MSRPVRTHCTRWAGCRGLPPALTSIQAYRRQRAPCPTGNCRLSPGSPDRDHRSSRSSIAAARDNRHTELRLRRNCHCRATICTRSPGSSRRRSRVCDCRRHRTWADDSRWQRRCHQGFLVAQVPQSNPFRSRKRSRGCPQFHKWEGRFRKQRSCRADTRGCPLRRARHHRSNLRTQAGAGADQQQRRRRNG